MRKIHLFVEGNQIVATWDNFDCLATSPAGFGDTIWQAFGNLIDNTPAIEINAIVASIENAPQNTKELAATVPAVAAANTTKVEIRPCGWLKACGYVRVNKTCKGPTCNIYDPV